MEIKGRVYCLFEQSGTFKNEFLKLGIPAVDYDIQNNFGMTDCVMDLFVEIEKAYNGVASLFDIITQDDLIIAFFPCVYFCDASQLAFTYKYNNYRNLTLKQMTDKILERSVNREVFFRRAVMMFAVAKGRGLRLILENPWSNQSYLKANFVTPPSLIDMDRTMRGDYYMKPTAYWFVNCEPTHGVTLQRSKFVKKISSSRPGSHAGICSEERSMISSDYARNFICDFIIAKVQRLTQLSIF